MALIIIFLLIFHVDYDTYESGAKYLSYFLTPATVALAVPLYEQIEPLKKNWKAILAGIFAGAMTSALCVLVLSLIFKLSHTLAIRWQKALESDLLRMPWEHQRQWRWERLKGQ